MGERLPLGAYRNEKKKPGSEESINKERERKSDRKENQQNKRKRKKFPWPCKSSFSFFSSFFPGVQNADLFISWHGL